MKKWRESNYAPELTQTIDWFSFTLKDPDYAKRYFRSCRLADKETPTAPRYGYSAGYASESGVLRYANKDHPEMGIHYVFPGSALRAQLDTGLSPYDVLDQATKHHCKCTRLDLARDAQGAALDLETVWTALVYGRYTGRTRTFRRIEAEDGGCTIYLGSPTSDKSARLYNKGIESKQGGAWFRFELQLRQDVAQKTAYRLADNQALSEAVFNDLSQNMAQIESADFEAFFSSNCRLGLPQIEDHSDTEAWIKDQCTGAILKYLDQNPESAAAYSLYVALDYRYRMIELDRAQMA